MNRIHRLISKIQSKEKYITTSHSLFFQKSQDKNSSSDYQYPNEKMKGSRHMTWRELHPDEELIGDSSNRHIQDKIILLAGEIIRGGLAEYGTGWLDYQVGRYWCMTVNAEPGYLKKQLNSGMKPVRPKNMRQ